MQIKIERSVNYDDQRQVDERQPLLPGGTRAQVRDTHLQPLAFDADVEAQIRFFQQQLINIEGSGSGSSTRFSTSTPYLELMDLYRQAIAKRDLYNRQSNDLRHRLQHMQLHSSLTGQLRAFESEIQAHQSPKVLFQIHYHQLNSLDYCQQLQQSLANFREDSWIHLAGAKQQLAAHIEKNAAFVSEMTSFEQSMRPQVDELNRLETEIDNKLVEIQQNIQTKLSQKKDDITNLVKLVADEEFKYILNAFMLKLQQENDLLALIRINALYELMQSAGNIAYQERKDQVSRRLNILPSQLCFQMHANTTAVITWKRRRRQLSRICSNLSVGFVGLAVGALIIGAAVVLALAFVITSPTIIPVIAAGVVGGICLLGFAISVVSLVLSKKFQADSRHVEHISSYIPEPDETMRWPNEKGVITDRKVHSSVYSADYSSTTAPMFRAEGSYHQEKRELKQLIDKIDEYHKQQLSDDRDDQLRLAVKA